MAFELTSENRKVNVNTFEVPKEKLVSNHQMISGNFIAKKASGYYNGNKTSWQVYEVEWIVGEFVPYQNDEVDLGGLIIENQEYEQQFITTQGSMCYLRKEFIGEMSKIAAKKLITEKSKQQDYVVSWSYDENLKPVKKSITRHKLPI